MRRLLPVPLRRPANLISVPDLDFLPAARSAGFIHGDPAPWAPTTLRRLDALPWKAACDLLLAPAPRPGDETESLLTHLDALPAERPVVLYERDWPVWPNVLVHDGGTDVNVEMDSPAQGLRAYRSAFRHGGRGYAEALQILPAARTADLLRGRARAAMRAGGDPLLNRRFLVTALDHQRSAALVTGGNSRLAAARRVAVIAPHFDDDVIMAGGAILEALAAGAEVRMIWLTDGARGIPGMAPDMASRLRKDEARAAMAALGVRDLHFLDLPEERVAARRPWARALGRLLEEFQPERTHVVWWADNHVDHYEASRLLRAAWPASLAGARIAAAGTWAPIPASAILPLDENLRQRKDQAIRAYVTQLQIVEYLRAERGLGRLHALGTTGARYVERYWECEAAAYFAAFRASGADRRLWL